LCKGKVDVDQAARLPGVPIPVHSLEHLLQLGERTMGLIIGRAPHFYLDDRAEYEQFGAMFLVPMAGGQQGQAGKNG
jgi:hypothetical protein